MAELIKTGSDWLQDKLAAKVATTITIRRGTSTASVSATVGRTRFGQEAEGALIESFESRDYMIDTADYDFGGGAVLPARGDEIDETVGGVTYTYGIMADQGEPQWRYSDPYRKRLRIHTKLIQEA